MTVQEPCTGISSSKGKRVLPAEGMDPFDYCILWEKLDGARGGVNEGADSNGGRYQ